jgi:hypothetical protein
VPQAHVAPRRRVVVPTGTALAAGVGPNIARLKDYVVDVTADGRMDTKGQVTSSPEQITAMAARMGRDLDDWASKDAAYKRKVVLYAHGGLVGEAGGVAIADRMVDWWKSNRVYPVHIVWESDAITTIAAFLEHAREALPFGGVLDGFWEAADRVIEGLGRNIASLWAEMKTNARLASGPRKGNTVEVKQPGVTLFLERLAAYRQQHQDLEVHLVAHSAGSVVMAGVVGRLVAMGIPVESIQLMGGAISVDEFARDILKHLPGAPNTSGMVRRFTAYDLDNKFELDDVCPGPPAPAVYHKSLLYFVARALEPATSMFERPMIGLQAGMNTHILPGGKSVLDIVGGASFVVAPTPSVAKPDSRSQAHGHGDFDDDEETMTSVVLRILKKAAVDTTVHAYPKGGMPSQQTEFPGPAGGDGS